MLLDPIVNVTTIVSDTSFYYAVLFMQRSLNLQTTKIDNKLSDSHKRKHVLNALLCKQCV